MSHLKKFLAILFIGLIVYQPTIYAGDGYTGEEATESETATEQQNKPAENPNDNKKNSDDDKKIEPPSANIENPNVNNENSNVNQGNENYEDEDFYYEDETKSEVLIDTGIIGDVNGDNELNAVDLVILQKYLKGDTFEINENAADINGDGTVSMFDVYALLNLIKSENKGTGDINNDGKVNIYDAQTLTAYLANPQNTPINSGNADLNGDGRISTDDLKILRKVIFELQQ